MPPTTPKTKELLSLKANVFIEFFDIYIDSTFGFIRIHSGKNFNKNIIYKGNEYISVPVEFVGAENTSSGKKGRPVLSIANTDGLITNYIKNKNDLNNTSVRRFKVLAKNIDDVNFSDGLNPFYGYRNTWSYPNYGPELSSETYIINSKTREDGFLIEFELSSPLDLENVYVPTRVVNDAVCPWVYRGCGCFYGKRARFAQTQYPDRPAVTEEEAEKLTFTRTMEVGLPLADINDKEFLGMAGSGGYNIFILNDRGIWESQKTYNIGDFVSVQKLFTHDFNKERIQEYTDDGTLSYFVCISDNVSGTNPLVDRQNWVKDECSKTVVGCQIRWQKYYSRIISEKDENAPSIVGLPFGGFPGTRPYEYRSQ